jgi:hypothetical protein
MLHAGKNKLCRQPDYRYCDCELGNEHERVESEDDRMLHPEVDRRSKVLEISELLLTQGCRVDWSG